MVLLVSICLALISCAAEKQPSAADSQIRGNRSAPAAAGTGNPAPQKTAAGPAIQARQLAPLPANVNTASLHSPFADGSCIFCHRGQDPQDPGPLLKPVNELCLDCHVDFTDVMAREYTHAPSLGSCVNCHNPHNSRYAKLLMTEVSTLCLSCHSELRTVTTEARVKHDATIKNQACNNCHNPHAANVEHLLISLPFDLCITCHGEDNLKDDDGNDLTNFSRLLAENPVHHGPVADKDCSACHNPHGAEYFRLLIEEYPPRFYSPYDPENYGLCFECHEQDTFEEPRTETLTLFRDGDRNLHYLHVNKDVRGRTCRACHAVHASSQAHHIREGVPYGSAGWVLKINYSPTPDGGKCGKNCHDSKSYVNQSAGPGTSGGR